jgi:hypothetical protein
MKKTIFRFFKIGDFFLIGLLWIGFLIALVWIRWIVSEGQEVSIYVNNREVYRLSLFERKTVSIQGIIGQTTVEIADGEVWVEKAPCPHQICKHMGKINRCGETIVCIPNRILIQIKGIPENQVDGITM